MRLIFLLVASMLAGIATPRVFSIPADLPPVETRLQKMEFHVVWEEAFDKKIKDVAWGETEDGRLYPKIIVFEDEVRFHDPNSVLLKTIPLSSKRVGDIIFSKKGDYVGIPVMTEVPTKSEKGKIVLTIYTRRGEKHCRFDKDVEFDGSSPGFSISDRDGSFVESYGAAQRLTFRDGKAKVRREVDLFEGDEWTYKRDMKSSSSGDGRLFAVLATKKFVQGTQYVDQTDDPNIYVILFDENGKELWRKPINEHAPTCLSISSQGKYLLAGGENRAGGSGITSQSQYLLDRNGSLIMTYHIGGRCRFSQNEEYLTIAGQNTIGLIQTSTGELLWSKQFSYSTDSRRSQWRRIVHLDISGNGALVGVSSTTYRRRKGGRDAIPSDLVFINNEGQLVAEKEPPSEAKEIFFKINSDATEIVEVAKTRLIKSRKLEQ